MNITYIDHSCFLLETDSCYYLFDYYRGDLPALQPQKPIIVFASHGHHDHYQPEIFSILRNRGMKQIRAVLSDDISRLSAPEEIDCLFAAPGREYQLALGQQLITLPSTDAGVAFLIRSHEGSFYHAGDLNEWVWEGEAASCNEEMIRSYRRQIDRLAGILNGETLDAAFVVLDPRQEKDYARGMLYFLNKIRAAAVYPMHYWEKPQIITQFLEEYPQYREKIKLPDMAAE